MVFCFVQNFFFGKHKSQNIYFLCRAKQNLTLGYMTKTLNQIIFFFLHQNQNIFFSNIGKQDIFFEKNHNHPFKLNGRSLTSIARHNTTERIVTEIRLLTRVRRYIYCLSQTWLCIILHILLCDPYAFSWHSDCQAYFKSYVVCLFM